MQIFLILVLLIVVLLFGLSSMSQVYLHVKQVQATIEVNLATQIASAGNLLTVALVIVAIVVVVVLLTQVYLHSAVQPKRHRMASTNTDWEDLPKSQTNAMLPALVTMLAYQLMQSQQEQHQHEAEQFWMTHEPANDSPTFSDTTWDL